MWITLYHGRAEGWQRQFARDREYGCVRVGRAHRAPAPSSRAHVAPSPRSSSPEDREQLLQNLPRDGLRQKVRYIPFRIDLQDQKA